MSDQTTEVAVTSPAVGGLPVSTALPEGVEWQTARAESPDRIVFDSPGDIYIGVYTGQEVITFEDNKGQEQSFTAIHWKDENGPKVTYASWALAEAYKTVPIGALTRNVYVKDVDVDQASAMKDITVEYAVLPDANSTK